MKRIALLIVALLIATGVIFAASIDPDVYKPRLVAAVKRATGRDLTIGGRLRFVLRPWPALEAGDVALATPTGTLSAPSVRLQVALLPLLHHRIEVSLTLTRPEAELATHVRAIEQRILALPGHGPARADQARTRWALRVRALRIEDGVIMWHDLPRDHSWRVDIARLDAAEATPDAPIHLDLAASHAGKNFTLAASLGALARWNDAASTTPWPVHAILNAQDAALSVDGTLTRPRQHAGYTLDITGHAADLAALAPELPALRDLRLSFHAEDVGGVPRLGPFSLAAGASDLSATIPGLTLSNLAIATAGATQPITAHLAGTDNNAALALDATLPSPEALRTGDPFDLTIAAQVPDLAGFRPLYAKLPFLHDLRLAAHITRQPDHQIIAQGAKLTAREGDLAADLTFRPGAHPALQGNLSSTRLDLDALRAAFVAPAKAGPNPPAPEAAAADAPTVSSRNFDLSALHRADLDLQVEAGEIIGFNQRYDAITGHVLLQKGHLLIDRLAAHEAGGEMALRLDIDDSHTPPTGALLLHAPALSLETLLAVTQYAGKAAGTLEVEADLHGSGGTPHTLAASLNGSVGIAMVGGWVDNRLIAGVFDDALHTAKIPAAFAGNGHSDIRCLALRLDAQDGVAAIRAMLLDMNRFRLAGAGTIDLGRETLALRLRPYLSVAGSGLVVPLRLSGAWSKPVTAVDPEGAAEGAAALAAELASKGSGLSAETSALASAGEHLLGDIDTGNCAPALALARDGRPGPQPPPPKTEKVGDLLKSLFHTNRR